MSTFKLPHDWRDIYRELIQIRCELVCTYLGHAHNEDNDEDKEIQQIKR